MAAVAQSKLPPRNAFPFFDDRWKMEQLWKVSPVTRVCQTKDERHTSQKSPVLGLPLGVRPRFRSDFDFYFFFTSLVPYRVLLGFFFSSCCSILRRMLLLLLLLLVLLLVFFVTMRMSST